MRAVVQRVARASVTVAGEVTGAIDRGLLVLVGAQGGDTEDEVRTMASKIAGLRIFPDADDKMNLDVAQAGGAILAVSQFTLLGDCRRGRRPSFTEAARPEVAEPLFNLYVEATRALGLRCETGRFRTNMAVALVNDGPVTLVLDSRDR